MLQLYSRVGVLGVWVWVCRGRGGESGGGSGGIGRQRGERGGGGLALGGDFAFYVFEGVASVGVEVGVAERPGVFPKLVIIRVLDLMKVVLVELPHEAGKVGVLEHSWEDALRELVHVLYDETVALRSPRHDALERRVLQHLVQLLNKIARRRHRIVMVLRTRPRNALLTIPRTHRVTTIHSLALNHARGHDVLVRLGCAFTRSRSPLARTRCWLWGGGGGGGG